MERDVISKPKTQGRNPKGGPNLESERGGHAAQRSRQSRQRCFGIPGSDSFRVSLFGLRFATGLLACALLMLAGCATPEARRLTVVPKWDRFEQSFASAVAYQDPFQTVDVFVAFTAPSGTTREVPAFWDGGGTWRVRFSPDEIGRWNYETRCSDTGNGGLHRRSGSFVCTAATGGNVFSKRGPVVVSRDGTHFAHQDGTPFFWLADAAWNAALLSSDDEWNDYLRRRAGQEFTAVQFAATQWEGSPAGDWLREPAFRGTDAISINLGFLRRLDRKIDQLNGAGLLGIPVLLWAGGAGIDAVNNPGFALSEEQAIKLARHLVGRWNANNVAWILGVNGNYSDANAQRWRRIGRAVFGETHSAPVTLLPAPGQWLPDEFRGEAWLTFTGYQLPDVESPESLRSIISSRLDAGRRMWPARPLLPMGGIHEEHPDDSLALRRAVYSSVFDLSSAGASYGAPDTALWSSRWRNALALPGATQMRHLAEIFAGIDHGRLRPAPEILAVQPGVADPARHIAAARSMTGDTLLIYTPTERTVSIYLKALPPRTSTTWINPRTGERAPVVAVVTEKTAEFPKPSDGDWLLLLQSEAQ